MCFTGYLGQYAYFFHYGANVNSPFLVAGARQWGRRAGRCFAKAILFFYWAMCLINPSGINGFLAPFNIDKSYFTYPTIENYSVFIFKLKANIFRSFLLYFFATLGMLSAALFFLVQREGFKKYIFIGSLTLILSFAAMRAIPHDRAFRVFLDTVIDLCL